MWATIGAGARAGDAAKGRADGAHNAGPRARPTPPRGGNRSAHALITTSNRLAADRGGRGWPMAARARPA